VAGEIIAGQRPSSAAAPRRRSQTAYRVQVQIDKLSDVRYPFSVLNPDLASSSARNSAWFL
jgi:hypothetical protein